MGIDQEFDKELISAYFDDALSGSELQLAEELLATNRSAASYLSSLQEMRAALQANPVRAPRRFADLVLSQAMAIGQSEALPANHPIALALSRQKIATPDTAGDVHWNDTVHSATSTVVSGNETLRVNDLPSDVSDKKSSRSWQRFAAIAAASAAAILFGFIGIRNWVNRPDSNSEMKMNSLANLDKIQVDDKTNLDPANSGNGSDVAVSPFDNRSPIEDPKIDDTQMADAKSARDDSTSVPVNVQPEVKLSYLMILDVVVSEEAWKAGRFDSLLSEVGIPLASPITADAGIAQALEDTRVIVGETEADPQGARASIVFLHSTATRFDRLLNSIYNEKENFPDVQADLSMDPKGLLLLKLLQTQTAQAQSGKSDSAHIVSASSISSGSVSGANVAPQFNSNKARSSKPASSVRRPSPVASSVLKMGNNPFIEVLVILRQASAAQ